MSEIKQHLDRAQVNTRAIYRNENNKTRPTHDLEQEPEFWIKQNSSYNENNQCAPDNSPFWENGHNPLSSKGN